MTTTPDPALLLANNISDRFNHASSEEWMIARNAALAAIRETTERATLMAEAFANVCCRRGEAEGESVAREIAHTLRDNYHLEKGSNDE